MDIALERSKPEVHLDQLIAVFLFGLVLLMVSALPRVCLADTGTNLVDWFTTKSFHGTSEVFSKMNFVGQIMSYTISIFGLLGLFTVGMRIMITLLYLSGKNFWDNIDEIKSAGKGQKMFGMGALAKDAFNAQHGVGMDAIVSFVLSLFPNMKAYSEYAQGRNHTMNLSEDDTVTTYLLKSALPNIMIIFAFTMAFNGTLWQAYGVVVNGMSVVADTFVSTRLDTIVSNALNTGSNYQFGYSADNTEYGAFKQKVVKDVYNNVLSKCSSVSTDQKQVVGAAVDANVGPLVDLAAISALGYGNVDDTGTGITQSELLFNSYNSGNGISEEDRQRIEQTVNEHITDQDAKNLQYSVVVNKTAEYAGAITFLASDLGLVSDSENTYYVHMFISKKANSDETNYFEVFEKGEELENNRNNVSGTIDTVGGDSVK